MNKIHWKKCATRRVAVQTVLAWNYAFGKAMEKVHGISVKNTLVFRDQHKTEYYVDEQQHQAYVQGLFRLLSDHTFLDSFHPDAQATLTQILTKVTAKLKNNLAALSNQELRELYQDFILPQLTQFYIRMWTVFNIADPLESVMYQKLLSIIPDKEECNHCLRLLSSPLHENDAMQERINLLQIALQPKEKQSELLQQHAQHYSHIPMFDFDHDPYTLSHFQQEFQSIKDPQTELQHLQATFLKTKEARQKMIQKHNLTAELGFLLHFLEQNVFLRDHRDMIRQKLNLQLRALYQEIGKRLGLSIQEVATLTNDEILSCLKKGTTFPQTEAQQRAEAYLLIQQGNEIKIYSGPEAIATATKELTPVTLSAVSKVRGKTGSPGKYSGPAKLVYTNRDLHKVKTGDVLIAAMTRQDFTPAMRKAGAIVTDEGGVICHAAITAREFGIPCIVGAGNALNTFKDGELVEVNADKGWVRKAN